MTIDSDPNQQIKKPRSIKTGVFLLVTSRVLSDQLIFYHPSLLHTAHPAHCHP